MSSGGALSGPARLPSSPHARSTSTANPTRTEPLLTRTCPVYPVRTCLDLGYDRGDAVVWVMRVPSLLAAAVAALLTGCGGSEGQVIERWTLLAPAPARAVELPAHLNDALPKRIAPYRLEARVVLDASLRDRDVDLVIPHLPAQVALRADGAVVPPSHGVEGEQAHRHVGPHRWTIPRSAV